MKYLLLDDINYVKRKWKYLALFYMIWLIILIYNSNKINEKFVLSFLGLYADYNYIFMYVIYYVYSIFVPLTIAIIIYNKDLSNKFDNIFTRIDRRKWYLAKTLFIFAFIIVFKSLMYLMSFIFIKNVFNYYLYDLLSTFILINIIFLLLSLFNRYQYVFVILMIIIILKLKYGMFFLNIKTTYIFLVLIIIYLLNIFCIKNTINMQFERSDV